MAERMFDAVVIGAGPAGSTAALLLARAGWTVALVERKKFPRRKVCGEYLSLTNLPLFDRLGLGDRFRTMAGPAVRRVGLFAGQTIAHARLPASPCEYGRALAREQLDTWLRDQATAAGVEVMQPWTIDAIDNERSIHRCRVRSMEDTALLDIRAPIVVAAHGSWESGTLPTQRKKTATRPADLLAFKAHFVGSELPGDLMPLLAFPGGYGGMVHCDGGRVSLSCCIRRDRLALIRQRYRLDAGDAVRAHIEDSCFGVRKALRAAHRQGDWLAAGPIRPGIRVESSGGVFLVGNAAGEAHPVVAEGISMALQSSWLLAERLVAWKRNGARPAALNQVQRDYASAWRANFVPRIWASSAIAQWAMRPATVALSLPLVRSCPSVLTWGARFSGKATAILRT